MGKVRTCSDCDVMLFQDEKNTCSRCIESRTRIFGGEMSDTTNPFPGDSGEEDDNDKAKKEEFEISFTPDIPLDPELTRQMQQREQEIEYTRDFAKEIVAYWDEATKGGMPPQAVFSLVREWQQMEMTRRANLSALEMRMDYENGSE